MYLKKKLNQSVANKMLGTPAPTPVMAPDAPTAITAPTIAPATPQPVQTITPEPAVPAPSQPIMKPPNIIDNRPRIQPYYPPRQINYQMKQPVKTPIPIGPTHGGWTDEQQVLAGSGKPGDPMLAIQMKQGAIGMLPITPEQDAINSEIARKKLIGDMTSRYGTTNLGQGYDPTTGMYTIPGGLDAIGDMWHPARQVTKEEYDAYIKQRNLRNPKYNQVEYKTAAKQMI
jgi:hypothetical protein